ncbi:hypothetical protein EMCG_01791 [[Emmonsia] crescens]|uniref:Uncharacterized protein n=1 Tax=[Emmonsia] crescens TaxID=73230 RepID=A0A0G2I007_9EURO|nr:hypothetical protein EMCG_01791 [Emmonsia crescens UAMH 3008]
MIHRGFVCWGVHVRTSMGRIIWWRRRGMMNMILRNQILSWIDRGVRVLRTARAQSDLYGVMTGAGEVVGAVGGIGEVSLAHDGTAQIFHSLGQMKIDRLPRLSSNRSRRISLTRTACVISFPSLVILSKLRCSHINTWPL